MGGRGSKSGGGGAAASKKPYQKPSLSGGKPALTGSPKQVAWANMLRDSYIAVHGKTHPENTIADVMKHTDSNYWIRNRYGLGTTNAEQRAIQKLWTRST